MYQKRLLITNLHALSNRGDAAILFATLDVLRKAYPDCDITLAANIPNEFTELGVKVIPSFKTWVWSKGVNDNPKWHIEKFIFLLLALCTLCIWRITGHLFWRKKSSKYDLLYTYIHSDLVVNCGGNTMYARHNLAVAYWIIWFSQLCAIVCGKPLICMPQTIGPFISKIHSGAAGWLYRRSKLILVRDKPSYILSVDTLNIPENKCFQTPDMVVYMDRPIPEKPDEKVKQIIGISVMDWSRQFHSFHNQEAYELAIAETVRNVIQDGYEVSFFAQSDTPVQGENDQIPAQRIVAHLDQSVRQSVHDIQVVPVNAEDILSFYAQFTLVIATRMHAALLSLVVGTPVIPIAYTSKSWGFIEQWNIEQLMLDINTITSSELTENVRHVLSNMEYWKIHINNKIQELRMQCDIVELLQQGIS